MIWRRKFTLDHMAEMAKGCMLGHLGIEITGYGDDYLEGTMPVDQRTKQPFGFITWGRFCCAGGIIRLNSRLPMQ
ncbi:Putative esterase HI_1161 [Providencia stuartii]|nr:Putative esterase HI_1161 [Providencia stuartii]